MSFHHECRSLFAAGLLLLAGPVALAAEPPANHSDTAILSLAEAQRLALEADPVVARHQSLAAALHEQAVADAQLPDPKLKLGLQGLPVDSFSRSQEAMTQLQLGVVQSFPRGDSLALMGEQGRSLAAAEAARAAEQRGQVLRAVRAGYLEAYFQARAGEIVGRSRDLFAQLVDITQAHYAAGHFAQQDVLRAELELALLDDRRTQILNAEEKARADLAKWIGLDEAQQPLSAESPALPALAGRDALDELLLGHPLMRMEEAQVEAGHSAVALAREQYKPGWSLDVTYGQRIGSMPDGSERSDLLSAMVMVELPLFPEKRQDRRLAASQQRAQAALYARNDRLRELRRALDNEYATWNRLSERLARYRGEVLPQAEQHSQAALNAYQSRVSEFTVVMRAYLTELESRLQALRLEVDRAKTQANLLYLAGEEIL